jgi:hypothetical protein
MSSNNRNFVLPAQRREMRARISAEADLQASGEPKPLRSILYGASFAFSGASAALAIAMPWYASAVGGYPFYDPVSSRVCRLGIALSIGGLVCSAAAVWRSGPHRFRLLAPAGGAVMLVFWLLQLTTAYD